METESRSSKAPKTSQPHTERVYGQGPEIESDAYKLDVAKMLRDTSWNSDPMLIEMEHAHIFHTVDSDGKVHEFSSATGGHFHRMEVQRNGTGAPIVKCVSGPLQFVKRRVKGKWVKVAEPLQGSAESEDRHTHDVHYIRSTKVRRREASPIAANIIAADAQRTAPIPGVAG